MSDYVNFALTCGAVDSELFNFKPTTSWRDSWVKIQPYRVRRQRIKKSINDHSTRLRSPSPYCRSISGLMQRCLAIHSPGRLNAVGYRLLTCIRALHHLEGYLCSEPGGVRPVCSCTPTSRSPLWERHVHFTPAITSLGIIGRRLSRGLLSNMIQVPNPAHR